MEPSAISDLREEAQEVDDALNPVLRLPNGEEVDLSKVTMVDWIACRKEMLVMADESQSPEKQTAAQARLFEYVLSIDPRIKKLNVDEFMGVFWDFFVVVTKRIATARPRSPRPRSGNSSLGSSASTAVNSGGMEEFRPLSSGS